MVFIDLKKAFDTVDLRVLLARLEEYGIDGLEYLWFQSYLENRRQFCRVNGACSDLKDIDCGLPHGSCLGPLLFLIYINDLPLAFHKCNLTMYADDTRICYASKNIGELNTIINRDLDCLNKWLQGNKLSLNVVKTLAMVIGSQPNLKKIADKRVDTPSFSIGDSAIDLVKNVKYLGVQLDSNLDWNQHMKVLYSKVSRAIGFLKHAKKFVPRETLIQTYKGIVEPHFRCCCSVWGSCGETRLRALKNCKIGQQGLSPIAITIHLLPF